MNDLALTEKIWMFLALLTMFIIIFSQKKTFKKMNYFIKILNSKIPLFIIGYEISLEKKIIK